MRITQSLLSWRSFHGKIFTQSGAWAFLPSAAAILTLLFSTASSSFAGSATWQAGPATGDWNTASNWTPATVPNGFSDTATLASSNTTGVSLSANTEVNGIVFNAGASPFTITASPTFTLTISGLGITNNSAITQNFVTAVDGAGNRGVIQFSNSATAGSLTSFTNNGGAGDGVPGGLVQFFNTSTAGNGTFINNGGARVPLSGGVTDFLDTSTAGNGTFINNGGPGGVFGDSGVTFFSGTSTAGNGIFIANGSTGSDVSGGFILFVDSATAGNGTFTTNGAAVSGALGGLVQFDNTSTAGNGIFTTNGAAVSGALGGTTNIEDTSTAGNATLIANGGTGGGTGGAITFSANGGGKSHGGTARVEVFGNGNLNISRHAPPGVTIGSIEGTGNVFLGGLNLTVGTNNLSTTFSGVIQDGGPNGGTGGSFTKVGKGKLTFVTANTYTGGTAISKGTLLVKNKTGSATGTGAVQVNVGTLGGTGTIAGAVAVGTGSSSGAILLPGNSATKPGTLTINSTLTFNSLSTYKCLLNRSTPTAGKVTALGVTISSGAPFTFVDTGTGTLTTGTVFTVINNTAATPISGTFSNLADGSVFTSNGNNFKASYTGGTGNDLTLTVQ